MTTFAQKQKNTANYTADNGNAASPGNLTVWPVRTNTLESRPDWILYTVPSFAFVVGLFLFTLVCKTQRHREIRRVPVLKSEPNGTAERRTRTNTYRSPDAESLMKDEVNLTKQEAQSYENVVAAIYSNQDEVTYVVSPDEDYITPDAMGEERAAPHEQDQNIYLQPTLTLAETDGESYENMEGCVYAQPRRHTHKHTLNTDDDDYIDPDPKQREQTLEQTDTESYENMDGPTSVTITTHTSTDTLDDESYVHMNSIEPKSNGAWTERKRRGESERRGETEKQWYNRQKTM